MDNFARARTVRLRSAHGKSLCADDDMSGVSQERDWGERSVWEVEISAQEPGSVIRLKSAMGCYLTASDEHFLLGMTGKKVLQTVRSNRSLESLVEWEPIAATDPPSSSLVKLRTRHGNFLRANGGIPPWRNSVTHDVPVRTATQAWLVWEVEVVESNEQPRASPPMSKLLPAQQLSFKIPTSEGRLIRYAAVWDRDENIPVPSQEWPCFHFHGHTLADLSSALKRELDIEQDEEIVVCTRHDPSGKIYPLQLGLPPNAAPMNLVIVRSRPSQS